MFKQFALAKGEDGRWVEELEGTLGLCADLKSLGSFHGRADPEEDGVCKARVVRSFQRRLKLQPWERRTGNGKWAWRVMASMGGRRLVARWNPRT